MSARISTCVALTFSAALSLVGCTPEGNADPAPSPSYERNQTQIRTDEGLVFPVPTGWAVRELGEAVGSYWELRAADPEEDPNAMSVTIRTGDIRATNDLDLSECPSSIEESVLESCGFVEFGGVEWRRIVGRNTVRFVDLAAATSTSYFRLIGFPGNDNDESLQQVESVLMKGRIE